MANNIVSTDKKTSKKNDKLLHRTVTICVVLLLVLCAGLFIWKKNAKGQDIYLGMAVDSDGLVNLIMCDEDGKKLSAGNLLLFTDTDKAVEYNWRVGDQYPGEKDMHDRIVIAD